MPKRMRSQKGQEMRPVAFRMPLDVYNDLVAVAEARGVDVSGILNWIISGHRPLLLLQRASLLTPFVAAPVDAAALQEVRGLLRRIEGLLLERAA